MNSFLGIDTSNYTTSVAVYDSDSESFFFGKKLLPVKSGEKGIRQSDAVFHHTVQLPELLEELCREKFSALKAVGVSVSPTDEKGSYMPCFLAGAANARAISAVTKVPLFCFSHQLGHIAAVIATEKRFDLLEKEFIAFHISGGTTQALLVKPDKDKILSVKKIAESTDLKAGQAIDRAGVMLGLDFPCGKELDALSRKSERVFNTKPSVKGSDISLSGIENKFKKMFDSSERPEDIAKFTIQSICDAILLMAQSLVLQYGNLPLVFSGGVSSNSLLREVICRKYNALFAGPEFSTDNAVGIAYLSYLKYNGD